MSELQGNVLHKHCPPAEFVPVLSGAGVRGEDPSGPVRGRACASVRKGWSHLGPEADDRAAPRNQPRVRLRHLLHERGRPGGCQTGEFKGQTGEPDPTTDDELVHPFSLSQFNNYEIRPGKQIGVCISAANNRLFVGSIPKNKTKEQILEEFAKVTGKRIEGVREKHFWFLLFNAVFNVSLRPPEGLSDVILYHQPDDKKKNRGFCFLEYEDHKSAAQARRRLMSGKVKVWSNVTVTVEWADPIEDPDPEVMKKVRGQGGHGSGMVGLRVRLMMVPVSQVKVLFVRNLANGVTEETLEKAFGEFGKLERVKKLKDYAFIHFEERDGAVKVSARSITPQSTQDQAL